MPAFLLAACLAVCLTPVWLLRRHPATRRQDDLIASQPTPPRVVANAAVAYALRAIVLGPAFALGAAGDLWPVIVGAVSFAAGVFVVYAVRGPMCAFLDDALRRDGSITPAAFLARRHGNDRRIRLVAAALAIVALLGLTIAEATTAAEIVAPALVDAGEAAYGLMPAIMILALASAVVAGSSGAMQTMQVQLGFIYLGLFGSAAFLLYLQVSSAPDMPPAGLFAVLVLAICSAVVLVYRRSRYVDTTRLAGPDGVETLAARFLRGFEKTLNPLLSAILVFVLVVGLFQLYFSGGQGVARSIVATLAAGSRVPAVGLMAVAIVFLVYPVVDVGTWQRIAALRKNALTGEEAPAHASASLRRVLAFYALEPPLVWLFMCMLGAIAAAQFEAGEAGLRQYLPHLASQQNAVATMALWLLLLTVLAAALSAMTGLFSAMLCTMRYDVLPPSGMRPEP